jgi:hypothetical protein
MCKYKKMQKRLQGISLQAFNNCIRDPGGIQTHDLQNRNLTFYSAELRGHCFLQPAKLRIQIGISADSPEKTRYFFRIQSFIARKASGANVSSMVAYSLGMPVRQC